MDLADKLKMALDEGRLLILGAQVVFGCQFQMVFQERFQDCPSGESGRAGNRPAGAYARGRTSNAGNGSPIGTNSDAGNRRNGAPP
jgi:hypothetical protein